MLESHAWHVKKYFFEYPIRNRLILHFTENYSVLQAKVGFFFLFFCNSLSLILSRAIHTPSFCHKLINPHVLFKKKITIFLPLSSTYTIFVLLVIRISRKNHIFFFPRHRYIIQIKRVKDNIL